MGKRLEHHNRYFYKCQLDVAQGYLRGVPGWQLLGSNSVLVPHNLIKLFPSEFWPIGNSPEYDGGLFERETLANGWKLRGYQHDGREFILNRRGTLLADAPRVGKTGQVVASHDLGDGQLLVVGPLMTRAVWLTWFKKRWSTKANIVTLKGRKQDITKLKNADVAFINYDIMSNWQNTVSPAPFTVCFDEAHLLSSPKTKRYKAAMLLATQASRVICATGTPLWNKPANAHSILDLVEPGGWGNNYSFTRRYTSGKQTSFGYLPTDVANEDELKLRLSSIMLRREWDDVVQDLPKTMRNIEVIELDVADRAKIDLELEVSRNGFKSAIADLARLRRIFALEYKTNAATNLANNYLSRNESVVVWTWHKDVAHDIYTRLVGAGYYTELITGETGNKDKVLESWKSYPVGALVITLGVGQTGIDLSHASHAIFAELDFTPAVVGQAEMRTFSPTRPMSLDFIVTDHPVELGIVKGLLRKCKMAEKTGLPAADTDIDFLGQLISEDDWLLDEEDSDSLLTGLLGDVMDTDIEDSNW